MIMTTKEKLITQVINGFQKYKGRASVYCFTEYMIPDIVCEVLKRYYIKHSNGRVFIVVDCYNTRRTIVDKLNANGINNNNHIINILSKDYIKTKYVYAYDFIITVGINDDYEIIKHLSIDIKFMLSILTKNIMDNQFITNVRNILPTINTENFDAVAKQERIYSPVEEIRIPVELSDNDRKLYDKYTDYINTCVSIFGDLSAIEKCKVGDIKNNISASDFRYQLALHNGWNETLDTSIPFMKEIDDNYNPNALYDRAVNFYNITKKRRDLITDNKSKLEIIKNIIAENSDKRILIISKRGEFAAEITKYINNNSIDLIVKCGDYHDCIEDSYLTDDYGNIILVKSGADKGKPRKFKSKAISTRNEALFNRGIINCLSIKNASDNKLKIAPDIVILTCCLYDNIIDIKTRFNSIEFPNPTTVYRLYCSNTIENVMLNKEKVLPMINVVNKDENNFVGYDEISGSVIL